jgi:outer membrane protein, heavy metal efflux system
MKNISFEVGRLSSPSVLTDRVGISCAGVWVRSFASASPRSLAHPHASPAYIWPSYLGPTTVSGRGLVGLLASWLLLVSQTSSAQVTVETAISTALKNHPLSSAAALEVQAKQQKERGTFTLPSPEINTESPTADFYTIGLTQSFEFPTIYKHQKNVAKAETALAEASQLITANDLRFNVRSLYLAAQVAAYQNQQIATRDSVYQAMLVAVLREFANGEIDFLQKTYVEIEAGKIHQERLISDQNAVLHLQQLGQYIGLVEPYALTLMPLQDEWLITPINNQWKNNPTLAYQLSESQVAQQQIELAKAKALPTFSIGYLNQGYRDSPLENRFKASISVPLWRKQYRAGIASAQTMIQAQRAQTDAKSQALSMASQRTLAAATTAIAQLNYHKDEALPRSQALIAAATRLREAGEIDYITFLKTLDQAYATQRDYADHWQAFYTAQVQLLYLAGN